MARILILLGSASDLPMTVDGVESLKQHKISFALHIASAHRSPAHVEKLVQDFDQGGGQIVICVAGMSAHLAGVVAAMTVKPVIAVPISRPATAGLDALLSMGQMPAGIPVATMGLDKSGFTNGCILARQILALSDAGLAKALTNERQSMYEKVLADDKKNGVHFST